MSGNEIKEKIESNNKLIEDFKPVAFTLNRQIEAALEENRHLRSICPHSYDKNGYCIYCDSARELE